MNSLCIYGKGKVGTAVRSLAETIKLPATVRDDADADFDSGGFLAVVPSPGVPPTNRAHSGSNVIAELDFAHRYLPEGFKIVGVTGTDGKSTTAWILFELLRKEFGDDRVFLSGNFEIPFSETVRQIREKGLKKGVIVIEISSFMLHDVASKNSLAGLEKLPEGCREGGFVSDYSIFTNFESDHLNWHADLREYFDDKIRLVERTLNMAAVNEQVSAKALELGFDFPNLPHVRLFGTSPTLKDRTDGENVVGSGRKKYRMSETGFSGIHNALNVLSATMVTNAMKICSKRTREYLKTVSGLAHRLEFVTEKGGVKFVDDSKSTSCQSLLAALSAFEDSSVRLIAGGSDKGDPFAGLGVALAKKTDFVALIGATAPKLAAICADSGVHHAIFATMDEAVTAAATGAKSGQTVLLSPGCASFGLFRDYLDRAEKFRAAVAKIDVR